MPKPDPSIDTSRIDEIPAKEPKFNAMPLKSALKKKPGTPQNTPTQENRPLTIRQQEYNSSFKLVGKYSIIILRVSHFEDIDLFTTNI